MKAKIGDVGENQAVKNFNARAKFVILAVHKWK